MNELFHKGNWDVIFGNGQQMSEVVFLGLSVGGGFHTVPSRAAQNALGSFRFLTTIEVLGSHHEVLNFGSALPSYPKGLTMHLK